MGAFEQAAPRAWREDVLGWTFSACFRPLQALMAAPAMLFLFTMTAILFMVGATELIFPRYILDEGLGIHADRARGPFLQAVANGLALNILGLIAMDSLRRHRLPKVPAVVLLTALPLAIVATKTRAVWLSFAGSILWLMFFSPSRCLRRTCLCLVVGGGLGLIGVLGLGDSQLSLKERLEESGPVTFRIAVYQAGWEMFQQKPISGWGSLAMQAELSSRISDFRQEQFYFHNTYLEVLVQYGVIGLALYGWVVMDLFRLGRLRPGTRFPDGNFLDAQFRLLWPLLVFTLIAAGSRAAIPFRLCFERKHVRPMLSYGIGLTASLRAWQLRTPVNPLIVGRFLGAEGVAYVALAVRIAEALGSLRLAAGRMAIAALARLQDRREEFRGMLERALYLQVVTLGPLLCVFALLGPYLVPHIMGAGWMPSMRIYPFAAAGVLVNSVYNLQASALFVVGKQWLVLQSYLTHVFLLATTTIVLLPRFGVIGYGWAELIACSAYCLIHFGLAGTVPISYQRLRPWVAGFVAALFLVPVSYTLLT